MPNLSQISIASFAETLNDFISSDPHSIRKSESFKKWIADNFNETAGISYIKNHQYVSNRVCDQFRCCRPIVVFLCDNGIKIDDLMNYISKMKYYQLKAVAIVIVSMEEKNGNSIASFDYNKLLIYQNCDFVNWAKLYF